MTRSTIKFLSGAALTAGLVLAAVLLLRGYQEKPVLIGEGSQTYNVAMNEHPDDTILMGEGSFTVPVLIFD